MTIFFYFYHRLVIPVFYIVLLTLCVTGQTAIWIKKFSDFRRDKKLQGVIGTIIKTDNTLLLSTTTHPNTFKFNNQKVNYYICSVSDYFLLMIVMFLLMLSKIFLNDFVLNSSRLNIEEKSHFVDSFDHLILNVVIPLTIYVKNDKLFKHVKNEILNNCCCS